MRIVQYINHVLVTLFAISSGIFKILGGAADVELFGKVGLSAGQVAIFGAVQAFGGVGLLFAKTSRSAAVLVAACNAFASYGLIANGVQPFGAVSVLFVVMALGELRLGGQGLLARPLNSAVALGSR